MHATADAPHGHALAHGLAGNNLTVAAVAELVGVAPSTLRTWARRYGLEPSGHRTGLHRRYSETDVARLQYMRVLTRSGISSREAAGRAVVATSDQLAALSLVPTLEGVTTTMLRPLLPVDDETARGYGGVDPIDATPSPAVQTLMIALGNGDGRGVTALLRTSLRDIGAARTWDERVVSARGAMWVLPPGQRERAGALLNQAVLDAVGDLRLRREKRNPLPIVVGELPGEADPVALTLLSAALVERSMMPTPLRGAGSVQAVVGAVGALRAGVLAIYVRDGVQASQVVPRVRAGAGELPQVYWGASWIGWPGQAGRLADVVRSLESAACPA